MGGTHWAGGLAAALTLCFAASANAALKVSNNTGQGVIGQDTGDPGGHDLTIQPAQHNQGSYVGYDLKIKDVIGSDSSPTAVTGVSPTGCSAADANGFQTCQATVGVAGHSVD